MARTSHKYSEEFIPTRQSLLSRLKDWDDSESWKQFFNTYWKLLHSVARKAGLTEGEAQDVVQNTIIEVSKKMKGFKYDPALGSFKGWLLNITRWRIGDQFRHRQRQARVMEERSGDDRGRTALVDRIPDPAGFDLESVWEGEWQRAIMTAATERVKRKVQPRHYQIFDLYVVKQWPIEKIAGTFNVSEGQVYLIKHRLSALLKQEVRELESQLI